MFLLRQPALAVERGVGLLVAEACHALGQAEIAKFRTSHDLWFEPNFFGGGNRLDTGKSSRSVIFPIAVNECVRETGGSPCKETLYASDMAGKRQHFIPRMLLRQFSDERKRVRLIRRDGTSLVTSIGNVALQNQFFGEPGPGSPDESITDEEQRIGPLLQQAISHSDGPISSKLAATLISHFTTRSRAMRTFMKQIGAAAIDDVAQRLSSGQVLRTAMDEHLRRSPEVVIEEFHAEMSRQYGKATLVRLTKQPNYPQIVQAILAQAELQLRNLDEDALVRDFGALISGARNKLGETVNSAHHRVALKSPTPSERTEAMMVFDFAVKSTELDIVLSDAVSFGWRTSIGVTPLFSIEADLQLVAMPISRRRLIIGWRGEQQQLLPDSFSLAGIQVSDEFVVAHPETAGWEDSFGTFGHARSVALQSAKAEMQTNRE